MAILNQLKSIFQLPGTLYRANQAEQQAKAVQSKLDQAVAARKVVPITPAQTPAPVTPAPAPASITPASAPIAPAPASQPTQTPQIDAIRASLAGIAQGLENLKNAPVNAAQNDLTKAEEDVVKVSAVTPEEQEAQTTLANLLASKELGLQAIREKAIPIQFITGQEAAVERRAAVKALPLQAQIATLQARRQSALDVAKSRLDIAKSKAERAKPNETKVDEFTNEKNERVIVFRDSNTGKLRQEVAGKVAPTKSETTQTERDRAIKVAVITKARPVLLASKGQDGYVDPAKYLDLRAQYAEAIGDPSGFDSLFSPYLSPQERARLFKTTGVTSAPADEDNPFK